MKTINIKGKDYVTVNERLIYFRTNKKYEDWQIHEDVISVDSEGAILGVYGALCLLAIGDKGAPA